MRLNKLSLGLIVCGLFAAIFIMSGGKAHAQNPAGPPEYFPPWPPASPFYPAYNFSANGGGTGWGYSVPQDFRYPPAVGWDPIANVYNGTNPSGNIEDLCRGVKKLLVPNMGVVYPSPYGYQQGPYEYTTYDSTMYVEYWAAVYQCWNSPADWGSASFWGTGMEIDVNGVPASINLGTYDGAPNDPDKGGWGGNWTGWGGNIGLFPGDNQVCMKLWGNYAWTQGGVWQSEPFGPLGFGCILVHNVRAPDATIFTSKYEPPSHAANGYFADVNSAINNAKVCIKNKFGVQFTCNTNPGANNAYGLNGWNAPGIWYSDNPYTVSVEVPYGWSVTGSNRGSPSCTLPGGQGTCSVTLNVVPGQTNYVDFWFKSIPIASCSPFTIRDPSNSNNPLGSTNPEIGQPVFLTFTQPNNLPPGSPHYAINNVSATPAGIAGLAGGYGPTNVGNPIDTGNITSATAQTYTINYMLSWDGTYANNLNCSGTITFTSKPYLGVYGNSVKAGASMAVNGICAPPSNPEATILTFDRGQKTGPNTENWKGSMVQYNAFALGEIDQFFSSGLKNPRTTSAGSDQALPVLDLTFGNFDPANSIFSHDPSSNSGLFDTRKVEGYGGVNVDSSSCVQDYYERISTKGGTAAAATIGARTISSAVAEYRNGDVLINGNINFPAAMTDGSVPSYYLAVKGNIYIDRSVSNISGVFIAEDDGSGTKGRIYTCTNGNSLYDATALYSQCKNSSLTVNGSFIAKQVKFQRTINSLKDGAPNEPVSSSRAAEIFNFSPETYIAKPDPSLATGSTKVRYDYITSLPPIL